MPVRAFRTRRIAPASRQNFGAGRQAQRPSGESPETNWIAEISTIKGGLGGGKADWDNASPNCYGIYW